MLRRAVLIIVAAIKNAKNRFKNRSIEYLVLKSWLKLLLSLTILMNTFFKADLKGDLEQHVKNICA